MGAVFDLFIGYLQSFLTIFYNMTISIGIPNYGIAIILMTIFIKMILYPLTVKQVKSMKTMQEMQPKIKAIQDKYKNKNNPEGMQREMTELYQKTGVNPMAGCLPLVAQMPIMIGIFYAIRDYTYSGSPAFLWMENLSDADPYYVLPVLSAVTTLIQQRQTTTEMNQQMKIMMIFMPVFIGWISCTFPAGLVVYWVVSNIMQILQQWWMYRNETDVKGAA